jgi:hypothetical protein
MVPPIVSPSARIERASNSEPAPVEHSGVYPGGGMLRPNGPCRIPPEVPVRPCCPFCVNGAIQALYSIDRLPKLPRHQRGFSARRGQVVGDLIRFEFGQPPARKGPDELLGPQHVPAHRCGLNPLRKINVPVTIPETPPPVGATSCRHEPTSLCIRSDVRRYAAATGDTEARGRACYTESAYYRYHRFCRIYCYAQKREPHGV